MTLPAVRDSHGALCGNLALLNVHDEFKTSSVNLYLQVISQNAHLQSKISDIRPT